MVVTFHGVYTPWGKRRVSFKRMPIRGLFTMVDAPNFPSSKEPLKAGGPVKSEMPVGPGGTSPILVKTKRLVSQIAAASPPLGHPLETHPTGRVDLGVAPIDYTMPFYGYTINSYVYDLQPSINLADHPFDCELYPSGNPFQ